MKNTVFLLSLLLLGFNSKTNQKNTPIGELVTYEKPRITSKKYFDYDEIIHYKNDFKENKIKELYNNYKKSEKDAFRFDVIVGYTPRSINEVGFLDKLETIGYTKTNVDSKKFKQIDEIFTEKKHGDVLESSCIYVYRDILIFRKKSKIVGIAKICFGCGASIILGTKPNTEEFGQSGDYEKLEKLLDNK
ncbi:hypothetical protein [Flavobacterium sp. LC2016-01]|uniref:hypothetical protein n=1 Tax=Flavobacterium sp. LC2016-01 TaxID=2675876 RepID=UPI0012BAD1C3|nr:hypothetical protein [Flavobacterium sp. LC2016-01]MTH16399.1 hypothetical protein [Flavobacterium sp. LC2016-01]